jgi:hypothetical protein
VLLRAGNDAPEPQALPKVLADETAPMEQIFFDLDCIDEVLVVVCFLLLSFRSANKSGT